MESIKAIIDCVEDKYLIRIMNGDDVICIPMSDDNQNEVKSAFNKIITLIRSGVCQITLEKTDDDLFSQVANEYITQLNREIIEVYNEMKELGLIAK